MPEKRELKELVLTRIPPGDRWKEIDGDVILNSLTDALNSVFEKNGIKKYYIDAGEGEVFAVTEQDVEPTPRPTPRKISLYGD